MTTDFAKAAMGIYTSNIPLPYNPIPLSQPHPTILSPSLHPTPHPSTPYPPPPTHPSPTIPPPCPTPPLHSSPPPPPPPCNPVPLSQPHPALLSPCLNPTLQSCPPVSPRHQKRKRESSTPPLPRSHCSLFSCLTAGPKPPHLHPAPSGAPGLPPRVGGRSPC